PGPYDNRWGDYSAACVDPANDTDLWTLQEYTTQPNGQNDEWSTWWSRVTPVANATSGLIITPDPASVGRAVQFTLGVPLTATVSWDFGDGSTLNGASVSHTYSAPGSYTVSASVSDISGSFSASAPLQVFVDTDDNGVPDIVQADADGDGFPDAIELLAGTSPTDASSTPVSNLPAVTAALSAKFSLKYTLTSGTGIFQLSGTLPVPSGFSPAGQDVYVDALGIAAKFTLDTSGGTGASTAPFFKLISARNGSAAFKTAILSALTTDKMLLKHQGFDFKNKYKSQPRTVPLAILFNGTLYSAMNQVKLSVTPGKTATAK
ncbi:MAG TPA: PKD domain-containing protein, partial [Planctomycetota bacterium]|nr:PKD domain-containing protein [Planctomycetota bacterium]